MTRFGLSTAIFGAAALGAPEFDQIAAKGFTVIELTSVPDPSATRSLIEAAGLEIASLSVNLADAKSGLVSASELGTGVLVVRADGCRIRTTSEVVSRGNDNLRGQFLESLAEEAESRRVRVALEVPLRSSPDDVLDLISSVDSSWLGVCLDVGHAHLNGGAPEAIETLSGYILLAHLNDNNGREDAHRAPYGGSVDWPATLMELWKTGFTGAAVLEISPDPDVSTALSRAVGARTRLQAILDDLAQPMVFPE